MIEKFTRWDPVDSLQTTEDQTLYLNACFDEDPGDGSLIQAALSDIARAHGINELARETGISQDGLCRALSVDGHPEFATVIKVIRALGVRLHVQAA
jgi:probable addiction module antidote protein